MTCSILLPEAVAATTLKRLARLGDKCGVLVSVNPGTTVVYRLRAQRLEDKLHGTYWYRHQVDADQPLVCARVTIGDMPRFNGYTLIGRITHTEAGNMLALAPSHRETPIPENWRSAKPTCDHCGTKRPRKDTFLIQCGGAGHQLYRVGRNCLADFLKSSPEQLIALSVFQDALHLLERDWSESDGDGMCGGHWGHASVSPLRLLACAFSAVEGTRGVYIKADGHDYPGSPRPTRDTAAFLACERNRSAGSEQSIRDWKDNQPKPHHWADVVGAMVWLESEPKASDYLHNLAVAMQQPAVDRKTEGLIASVTAAYARHQKVTAERELAKQASVPVKSEHFGTIKERVDVAVTVLATVPYVGGFGPGHVVKMQTDGGHLLVSFATGSIDGVQVGRRMTVRGTVKAHDDRRGEKQTVMSRCVWTA